MIVTTLQMDTQKYLRFRMLIYRMLSRSASIYIICLSNACEFYLKQTLKLSWQSHKIATRLIPVNDNRICKVD